MSGSTLSLLKRSQGFKSCSRIKSPLWLALYPLQVDPVRAGISLGCDAGLKVPPTVGAHSGPPRGSDKKGPLRTTSWFRQKKLWPTLYLLRADPVRARINLDCDTGLKVPPTIEIHSRPPRGSDKKKLPSFIRKTVNSRFRQ